MALITSIASGNWSDPTIWDSGTVPTAGDDVIIDTGHTITIDMDIGSIGSDTGSNDAIRIEGELQWNGDVNCTATLFGNLHQLAGGVINFDGTADRTKVLTFYINASSSPADSKYNIIFDDIANVNINGYPAPTNVWVRHKGCTSSNQIEVIDFNGNPDGSLIADWQAGDKLITSDKQIVYIQSISGNVITLDNTYTIKAGCIQNHSRNIKFIEANDGYGFNVNNNSNINWTEFKSTSGVFFADDIVHQTTGCSFHINQPVSNRYKYLYTVDKVVIYSLNRNKWFRYVNGTITNSSIINCNFYVRNSSNYTMDNNSFAFSGWEYRGTSSGIHTHLNSMFIHSYLSGVNNYSNKFIARYCDFDAVSHLITDTGSEIYACKYGYYTHQQSSITVQGSWKIGKGCSRYTRDMLVGSVSGNNQDLFLYDVEENHDYYNYYCHTYNQTTVKYGQNEAVEIQSLNTGEFTLSSKILVDNNTSYKFDLYLMKDSLTATPPKVQLWKGTTLLDEASMPDTVNTWEKVSVSWFSDFDGFIEIRFVFTSDTGSEKFWISDERNSFHYWSEGYIIPVYPRNEVTPDTVAKAVWEYAVRTLTAGTRDNEIDDIKAQTDKMTFDSSNNIKSIAQNSELSNLDEKISTRKAANQIDFTDSDRTHLLSLQNYDDTQVKQLLNELLDIEEGNWEIKNNQMIFYKRDGSELMRFNLKDKNNQPSEKDVYKRERV